MTIREQFRSMRREFDEHGDGDVLREFVDQLTAPTYGGCPTRPTLLSRGLGGRRVTTWRDLQKDALFLFVAAGAFRLDRWGPMLDALLAEDMQEFAAFDSLRFIGREFIDDESAFKVRVAYSGGFDWRGAYPFPIPIA